MINFHLKSCLPRSLAPFFLLYSAVLVAITTNTAVAFNLTPISYGEGYSPLFSDFNIQRSPDGKAVSLLLNRHSGSGIISKDYYYYGFFSASIKLPAAHTAGIVVAFYTSNKDTFEKNHDELDMEFLGNVNGQPWRLQTNMYGNGSLSRGREERYHLWFDPSKESHRYTILWTSNNIIFYVDEVPIREVVRNQAMGGDFPSKPMSLYATMWDASSWATNGGKAKVDYNYDPFITKLNGFILQGCHVNPLQQFPSTNCSDTILELLEHPHSTNTREKRREMNWFRERYMYYSYCYDNLRYAMPLPECVMVPSERKLFKESGRLRSERMRFGGRSHGLLERRGGRSARQRRRSPVASGSAQQAAA